jgi:F-type H+-transporting ATPase subunit b
MEEAQSLLASYERKQKEIAEQSERIIRNAKEEAALAAEQAKKDLGVSIERRIAAANDQISSAQSAAIREVRNNAISVAISVVEKVIASNIKLDESNALIDVAISDVASKLH